MINDSDSKTMNADRIKLLTYMMFFMFAMTSDAVGVIIPELIKRFGLSLTQASAFHYTPMIVIALSGLLFGFLADKLGRKTTIILGLLLFTLVSFLFAAGDSFGYFLGLLCFVGMAVGLFKTGALALIGDISTTAKQHTHTMNMVEGFFGLGAIVGPALVSYLLSVQVSWKYLYIGAGLLCAGLCLLAWRSDYPKIRHSAQHKVSLAHTLRLMKTPHVLGFSIAIALYVATEVAIYVWMPTLLADYQGSLRWLSLYALPVFFILRAGGRFFGAWLLRHIRWQHVLFWFSLAILLCYLGAMLFGVAAAVILLPLSGLFMSVMYPTLNSKGISCCPSSQHGAVAGIILFFTAFSAALAPLLMGIVSDIFGQVNYGFYLASFFALLLFVLMAINLRLDPAKELLLQPH